MTRLHLENGKRCRPVLAAALLAVLSGCAEQARYEATKDSYQECVLGQFLEKRDTLGRAAINHAFRACRSTRKEMVEEVKDWMNRPAGMVDRAVVRDLHQTMRDDLGLPAVPSYEVVERGGVKTSQLHRGLADYWAKPTRWLHGAFAMSSRAYRFTTNRKTIDEAISEAVAACDAVSQEPCRLVAVDSDIVQELP
ncbi:hypothetical protein [Azospirillum thermophilum]|uniref:Lipoprotein n=1 Tax=Azospirillum thermophilum TaxID=2202148 RepID=A0A2S2CNV7_9PROT|nr:hypothetical protein [Azospirillum thermophilum]AWK86191.1 hypothetical protein DEW08_07930 [Azospirillum thermophilum]